jgi:acylphosphatase
MSSEVRQVTITGRVQGVGYRAWVEHRARGQGLEGWVRNRRDGSVEALFAGPPEAVSEMIASCQHGPSAAQVAAVLEEDAKPAALGLRWPGERFSVLPTV